MTITAATSERTPRPAANPLAVTAADTTAATARDRAADPALPSAAPDGAPAAAETTPAAETSTVDEPSLVAESPVPSRHLSLSPSRAADFKGCPLRYRFRVVDRLPESPSPAAVRGTLVHAVLEGLFDLSPGERTLQAARDLLPGAWAALQESDPAAAELFAAAVPADLPDAAALVAMSADGVGESAEPTAAVGSTQTVTPEDAWLTSAAGLLGNYFALEDPQRLAPAAREEYVEADLGEGLRLRGVIDRLDESATGALRVVDYKTGSSPSEVWESKALFQLKFYALVLWRTRGVVPAVLQLLYLTDTQKLTYAPDEAELVAFERQLRALWSAISQALDSGDFRARRGPLCKWCDHQARCPEFGGTPPPYPGLNPTPNAEGLPLA